MRLRWPANGQRAKRKRSRSSTLDLSEASGVKAGRGEQTSGLVRVNQDVDVSYQRLA